MGRYVLGILIIILIGAASTVGLAYNKDSKIGSFTITILSGCSFATITGSGNYDFGTIPAWTGAAITKDVVLRAWTNTAGYSIIAQATKEVEWSEGTPSAITLNNFRYTDAGGAVQTLTPDTAPSPPAWFTGVWTGAYQEHHAILTLNLTGNEAPGTYTTTVRFTMTATP